MSNFDKLQKILLEGNQKIFSEPEKSNLHRFNLFKSLIKFLIHNTNKKDKNKLVHNFDTGEPYFKKIQHDLNSRNRFKVSLAQVKPDLGLSFNEMNFLQRLCVMYIIQILVSDDIFYKFLIIMLQQNVLGEFADMKFWVKDKDEIAKVIGSYNPKKGRMNEMKLDIYHKDALTKHAYERSQGNYWSYIFLNKDYSKIGFAYSGHHINLNYNFFVKGNKIEIECMPFFIGSAPSIVPGYLKKDIKKITCKKYDRTQGFWYAMSGMPVGSASYYFNALVKTIKDNKNYHLELNKNFKKIGEVNKLKTGGHAPPGSSALDGFVDTCDSECFSKNVSMLEFNNMNIRTKNVIKAIVDYLQNNFEFKNDKNFTINNIVKDMKSFKFSWSGNLIESKKSKNDPLFYVRLMGRKYTIEYLISNEYTIVPSTTQSLYTHEHCIVRYTDSHFPYKRAFDTEKPYYLDKKYTRKIRKTKKVKTRRKN